MLRLRFRRAHASLFRDVKSKSKPMRHVRRLLRTNPDFPAPRPPKPGAVMASPTSITLQFVLPMGQLLFKKCFFDAIRNGTKRTTLRRWTSAPALKPASAHFTPGVGWLDIESAEIVDLNLLRKSDAIADGFSSIRAMRKMLAELYPDAADDRDGRQWFRVSFRLESSETAAIAKSFTRPKTAKRPSRLVTTRPVASHRAAPRSAPSRKKPSRPATSSDVNQQRRQLADALRKSPK